MLMMESSSSSSLPYPYYLRVGLDLQFLGLKNGFLLGKTGIWKGKVFSHPSDSLLDCVKMQQRGKVEWEF